MGKTSMRAMEVKALIIEWGKMVIFAEILGELNGAVRISRDGKSETSIEVRPEMQIG